jgi:hypothetical protein
VAEWLKASDCKFVEHVLRRFESYRPHQITGYGVIGSAIGLEPVG